MKKRILTTILAGILTTSMSMTSFAGWEQEGTSWKYNDNGTYAANGWRWIDGNGDGVAECYYFDSNGYMLANTTTPDGYTVNADGAWYELSQVWTKDVSIIAPAENIEKGTIPTGYNENGISNAAIDILEHTRAENAAKYGVASEEDMAEYEIVHYNGIDFAVWYYDGDRAGKPTSVRTDREKSSVAFKDAPQSGNARTDLNQVRAKGYSATTNGGSVAVDCGKYEALLDDWKYAEVYIKYEYK